MNVLLATHGRPALLHQTLGSLVDSADGGRIRKIVVVENGGSCGAEAIALNYASSKLIVFRSIDQANKSAALNEGLRLCDEGLIFLTDDDVTISPAIIDAYAEADRVHGRGHFYGGPTEATYTVAPPNWLKPFLPSSATGWSSASDYIDRCLGFNWAAYRSDLVSAGGFSPEFGPGSTTGATGQESDMQVRLSKQLGVKGRYVPNARVVHFVPPERCSPEWAVKRIFRTGIEVCLHQDSLTIAERKLLQLKLRARIRRIATLILRNTLRRFRADYWDSYTNGFEHGVALRRASKKKR